MKMQNLKVKIGIGADYPYQVDTGLLVPIVGKYYLPTSYKDPMLCKLVDYRTYGSVDNIIRVMAVIHIDGLPLKDVSPQLLFPTKDRAAQFYLNHKKELNFDYLKENKND